MKPKAYMNPYLAGVLLGLVLTASVFITGRGLGASGAFKSVVVASANGIAPQHTETAHYFKEYRETHEGSPMHSWLVFEMIGVVIGAFFSGIISDRSGIRLEKGPNIKNSTRVVGAIIGGLLFGFGSQLGRGCTSGSALSGMAVMSFGGIITMLAIFGSAYALAYFFRKLWLK